MKRIHFVLSLVLLLGAYACENTRTVSTPVLDLQETTRDDIRNADIFECVGYVPLETRLECLLSSVDKVEYFDGLYYVLDRRVQKKVLVFDEKGAFVRKIGVLGHGHGEYPRVTDFTIDKERGRLVVLFGPSRVYVYNLEGRFLESKEISKSLIWNIVSTDGGFIGATNYLTYTEGNEAFLFYGFDKDFNEVGKWVSVMDKQMYSPVCISSVLQYQNGTAYYWDNYTNGLYNWSEQGKCMQKVCDIKLANPMPTECFSNPDDFMKNQFRYDFIMEALVCGDKYIVAYIHDARQHIAVLSAGGDVEINGSYKEIVPNLFNGKADEIIYPVSAESYLSKWSSQGSDVRKENAVSPDDNYVLLKLKLK